jgi:hypothetical protein
LRLLTAHADDTHARVHRHNVGRVSRDVRRTLAGAAPSRYTKTGLDGAAQPPLYVIGKSEGGMAVAAEEDPAPTT